MGADVDVARWVLEFVLRQPEMDGLSRKLLAVLPISDDDLRLKKTVLLRAIDCEVADGYVNESVLEILEILEELDRSQGNAILDSMRTAYCMAAVECTVKFLVSSGGKPGEKYLKALNHIWRGRIERLERHGKSELVSGELKKWWDDVNSVLDDSNTCRRLCGMNTRNDALFSIHCYLEEAWGLMGPSFLELADGLMNKKERVVDTECDGGEFDGLDVQNLASLILLNHGEGSVLSPEICEEYNVHNSKISDVQCLEVQALTAVQLCNSWENRSGDDEVDEANSSPQERTELSQSFDVDIGNQSCRNLEKGPQPNLRERKHTVRTSEGEDSLDDLHELTATWERRIQPPSRKGKAVSLLKKNGTKKRRKNKQWSLREEDILRTSVKAFGRNWKFILNMHRDEFEERTEVDLKDKWRNMMKWCCN